MASVIKLLNTTRKVANLKAFDGDTMDLPASISEGIEVDAKFGWQLPKGVKNLTKPVEIAPVEEVKEKPPQVIPDVPATPLKTDSNK